LGGAFEELFFFLVQNDISSLLFLDLSGL